MLKNYLKVAWRNLNHQRTFSIINIIGLSISIGTFLIICLYVSDELSYDRYNEKADRIYRVNTDARFGGQDIHLAESSDMMGQLLMKDNPEVEGFTRLFTGNDVKHKLFKKGNEYIKEDDVVYADSTFFNVFTLPALEGNTATALISPYSAVISEAIANKYFGQTDVVGKTLETIEGGKSVQYKINAVIKNFPENSHFNYGILLSMTSANYQWGQVVNHVFYTYVVMKDRIDPKKVNKIFGQYMQKYIVPQLAQFHISSMEEFEKAGNNLKYSLIPLTKIHLYSGRTDELSPPGNIKYVYIFGAIAVFVLLIACVNFMNLSTALVSTRAKEVGIRKVLGTLKRDLIKQFLTESTLMGFISLLIGIIICYFALPIFNELSNKSMTIKNIISPIILPLLIVFPFLVGFLAGFYPAFYLSNFKPIDVLKGKLKMGTKGGGLRNVLVVFQFATSILLIISTLVVYRQLHYIQNKDIGFNKDQVLIVNGAEALGNHVYSFEKSVSQLPGIKKGTVSSFLPVSNSSRNSYTISKDPVANASNSLNVQNWGIDYDYIETMGMKLTQGRNFSLDFGDSSSVIINETTKRLLGYNNPIGRKIYTIDDAGKATGFPIIGVVKDFNYESLHEDVGPLIFMLYNNAGLVSFRISPENISQVISQVKNKWEAMAPTTPFSYRFLDDSFNEMYRAEQRVGEASLIFSILAIFIGSLGIFGLATYIAEQRTKEIGIRKVLGASTAGIVQLLVKSFILLVGLAFLIASPIAWWLMHNWLQDFAFRTQITWWIYLAAGLGTLFIALLTVSFQSVKAALMNPVKSLRTE